jgi:predicted nuclease of restriction endonuclease-like (RecB) superfamily
MTTTNNDLTSEDTFHFSQEYKEFFSQIKHRVRTARFQAALSVNCEVIKLYWHIGSQILERQQTTSWGSKFIATLSKDLRNAFPETSGFSAVNLKRMRTFALAYPNVIGSQPVTQLPWGHIITLIHKVKAENERAWYILQIIEQSWTRDVLERNISLNLYNRQALTTEKASNYLHILPPPQSLQAQELLKQPYNFDFLGLHDQAHEREIEYASVEHISKVLRELGKGFAFVGNQVPVALKDNEYFIDMLFYHLKLHCYVVVELKATKFKPEHTGQLNFYLNLVDDFVKMPEDKPTIGLLLCKSRNKFEAEYALKGIDKPIGISEYELTKAVPENLKSTLPSIQEIEAELNEMEINE